MENCDICLNHCSLSGMPKEAHAKKVFCFLGMPASGKSTQINFLQQNINNCEVFHVGKFAKKIGIPKQKDGSLLQGLDEGFLKEVGNSKSNFIVLDGFPRSIEQLVKLILFAKKENWQLEFIHIALPVGKEKEISLQRQIKREGSDDMLRLLGKIDRAVSCDLAVIKEVKGFYNDFYTEIDALQSVEKVRSQVMEAILLSYFKNDFSQKIIKEVQTAIISGTATISRSFIYTNIWNNMYGACQEPNDIDVKGNFDVSKLSSRRYSVKDNSFTSDLGGECLSFYRIAIALTKNSVSLSFISVNELYDTINGVVEFYVLEGKSYEVAISKLPKIVSRYPMLRFSEIVDAKMIEAGYFHEPLVIMQDWETINLAIQKDEYGGKPDMDYESSCVLDTQMQLAKQAFVLAKKQPLAPPRWANKNIEVLENPDWETNASLLDDNSFKEYLFKQANSRKGTKDSFIQFVLGYGFSKTDKVGQKSTHQGWKLHLHLLESALQLNVNDIRINDRVKLVIRTSMLFHDAGKVHNSNTPGSHQGIGAKLFQQQAFSFLTNDEVELGSYFIKWHDLFGRMYRGITEPQYKGAIHPVKVVSIIKDMPVDVDFNTKLNIMYAIWCADVNSVASLRWIGQLLPYIKKVIQEAVFLTYK
jgi:adenylate kinase